MLFKIIEHHDRKFEKESVIMLWEETNKGISRLWSCPKSFIHMTICFSVQKIYFHVAF